MGSHGVTCHPTDEHTPPSPQPDRLVLIDGEMQIFRDRPMALQICGAA